MTPATKRALLVVDVQNEVMARCVDADRVVATIAALVERARAEGVPVFWVRHHDVELAPDTPAWQIVPPLAPAGDEPIIDKEYGDAFAATALEQQLSDRGITEVVVCGAQSDFCVRSTFFGSLYHGFDTTLVSDAHTTEGLHQHGYSFSPGDAINFVNTQASLTRLPGVTAQVKTAAEALGA